jgi:hypothetical protein
MIVALDYILFRIKKTDAAKLQDEYARLVEGLQESAADASDEDAFMANPGSPRTKAALHSTDISKKSFARRPPERSCSRKYQKGRTFCGIFEAIRGVSQGT